LKFKGDYYTPKNKYTNYFVVGEESSLELNNAQVAFRYGADWPSRFEVWPTKNNLMIANPIGNQQGLAVMGFCYAPYKFVYDMYFPVLVQIMSQDGEEVFQFPVSVVIAKNNPKQALPADYTESETRICDNANTEITVTTYNINLEPVEADVEFKCLEDTCSLGKTQVGNGTGNESGDAMLTALVPQCVNGILVAKNKDYSDKKYIISTNEENYADIVLDRKYKMNLEIYVNGVLSQDLSILGVNEVVENSTNSLQTVAYPYNREIELSEGNYNFELMVYKAGSVTVPATTSRQCVTVPQSGILGLFGMEEEKCTDINLPSQKLTNVVYAGGNTNYYATPSELEKARTMKVYATSVKMPSSYEQIPETYDSLEGKSLDIVFE
jgi:hypothetical protein